MNGIIQDVPMVRDIPRNSINHSISSGEGWLGADPNGSIAAAFRCTDK